MAYIQTIELREKISKLPDITVTDIKRDLSNQKDDLFLCALGFEERTTVIPRLISESNNYRCNEAIYFEYSTNPEDNEINRPMLETSLSKFSNHHSSIQCNIEGFLNDFRDTIARLPMQGERLK